LNHATASFSRTLYGVRSPGPGSDIVGDVVEWFETRAEAERFIAEVASEPNPEDAVLAEGLSVVEVDLHWPEDPTFALLIRVHVPSRAPWRGDIVEPWRPSQSSSSNC
jgi:hypothetical protein